MLFICTYIDIHDNGTNMKKQKRCWNNKYSSLWDKLRAIRHYVVYRLKICFFFVICIFVWVGDHLCVCVLHCVVCMRGIYHSTVLYTLTYIRGNKHHRSDYESLTIKTTTAYIILVIRNWNRRRQYGWIAVIPFK